MQNNQSTTITDVTSEVIREPHLLTQAEFIRAAQVVRLINHGRKWDVRHGNYSAFSDAGTPGAAVIDVHHAAVNNALYFNEADAPDVPNKPSVPTRQVLAAYPDLVAQYAHVLEATG